MAIPEHEFNLIDCQNITPRVKHFIASLNAPTSFQYIPGQFITIVFEHEQKTLRRSYSIANVPNQQNTIEFAAGYVENGPGTQFLFNLTPGDKLKIQGPFGRLILKDEPTKRLILIGTSTGITPYRAMLDVLTTRMKSQPELEVHLIQGVAKQKDILFEQDFLDFCATTDKAHFTAALSQETHLQSPHHQLGRVQASLEKLTPNPETDLVYLCGNPNMIDDCTTLLEAKGFPIQKIIREKYISR